jgi:hypothetical protein
MEFRTASNQAVSRKSVYSTGNRIENDHKIGRSVRHFTLEILLPGDVAVLASLNILAGTLPGPSIAFRISPSLLSSAVFAPGVKTDQNH